MARPIIQMKALSVALALLAATPASACHRFQVWKYPYPQRCAVVSSRDRAWYVEITKLPDEVERDRAIEALKQMLEKQ